MSKEWLEEIEAKYSTLTITSERDGIEYTDVDVKDLVFLIQNGFKQAERVGILLEQTGHNFEVNRKLDAQNKRYREAIEKAKNAMCLVVGGEGSATKVAHDILRKALEDD